MKYTGTVDNTNKFKREKDKDEIEEKNLLSTGKKTFTHPKNKNKNNGCTLLFPVVQILNGGRGPRVVLIAMPRKLLTIKVDPIVQRGAAVAGRLTLLPHHVHVDVERLVLLEKVFNGHVHGHQHGGWGRDGVVAARLVGAALAVVQEVRIWGWGSKKVEIQTYIPFLLKLFIQIF